MIARALAGPGALLQRHRYRHSMAVMEQSFHTCAKLEGVVHTTFGVLEEMFSNNVYQVQTVTFLCCGLVHFLLF